MRFRDRLLSTLRHVQPVLDVPGVLVGGSQVPNLLEPDAASTLVVSRGVDLVVPIGQHREVIAALERTQGFSPTPDEPSVWLPADPGLLEVNFIGSDPELRDAANSYVLEDDRLPLLVFGLLSLLREGLTVHVGELRARLPRPAGLLVEKLLTERSGLKGQRDLLVALGMLLIASDDDLQETVEVVAGLTPEQHAVVRNGLTVLSLTQPLAGMPDPTTARDRVASLLARLEAAR
jgi:hypothetical protein